MATPQLYRPNPHGEKAKIGKLWNFLLIALTPCCVIGYNSSMAGNEYEIRGEVVALKLRRKSGDPLETLIDLADLERVQGFHRRWRSVWSKSAKKHYVSSTIGPRDKVRLIYLHRFLMQPPADLVIDHINHDSLDNRRCNLRIVTIAENNQNYIRRQRPCITWIARAQKWQAQFEYRRASYYLGLFRDREEAMAAVVNKRQELTNAPADPERK